MPKLDLKFWGVTRNRKSPEVFFSNLYPAKLLHQMTAFQALGKNLPNCVSAAGRVIMKPCCSPSPARPGVHISSDPCSPYLLPYLHTLLANQRTNFREASGFDYFQSESDWSSSQLPEARLPTLLEQQHTFLLRLEGAGRWLHPWGPQYTQV